MNGKIRSPRCKSRYSATCAPVEPSLRTCTVCDRMMLPCLSKQDSSPTSNLPSFVFTCTQHSASSLTASLRQLRAGGEHYLESSSPACVGPAACGHSRQRAGQCSQRRRNVCFVHHCCPPYLLLQVVLVPQQPFQAANCALTVVQQLYQACLTVSEHTRKKSERCSMQQSGAESRVGGQDGMNEWMTYTYGTDYTFRQQCKSQPC